MKLPPHTTYVLQPLDVAVFKLPPHTTYVLQPLDVAVFKGLTTNWDKDNNYEAAAPYNLRLATIRCGGFQRSYDQLGQRAVQVAESEST
ncbi:ISXO2-like transposase domain [Popillia japonica]|uniref:ISXO2-like transposase domain n=1 Tax=Popillia japonica TaxID=7064 RepID=A0AAW1N325_POPJA